MDQFRMLLMYSQQLIASKRKEYKFLKPPEHVYKTWEEVPISIIFE
jgi:hypothetical protein